jgi:hypothetical protein
METLQVARYAHSRAAAMCEPKVSCRGLQAPGNELSRDLGDPPAFGHIVALTTRRAVARSRQSCE